MKMTFTITTLGIITLALGLNLTLPALDSVYFYYAEHNYSRAFDLLLALNNQRLNPAQQFALQLELGDYYLDKTKDYPRAESIYQNLLINYPKHPEAPAIIYRLALSQELQENFMEAAKNYEQVATRYLKSPYAQDALDAIERCFKKNYQERVAYVNGYPITRIELDDRISRNPAAYEPYEKKLTLLDTMIDNRLLYEAANAAGLANEPQVAKTLNDIRNRQMFQTWYERYVTDKAEPTEKELRANYKKNIAKYTTPEKVHGFQLVVASKTLADSLRAVLLADTGKWDTIVKTYSIAPDKERSGDMGLFARGVQPKPIEQVAFKLKPGEISIPIAINDTFYIIRVTEKKPKEVKTFDQVKNQIAVELRQERSNQIYEKEIARLKKAASVIQDTLAIDQNKDTLAVVNGVPITSEQLEERLNSIPPFFRGQFETPEGKRRILDQLIVEKLLLKECEKEKIWLSNRVIDQLLNRRTAILIDAYRKKETTEKVQLDSATLYAEYQKTINDFKEPTRVRCREMVTKTRTKAEQLRTWALAGRIPQMIHGIALFVSDPNKAQELAQKLKETTNTDSLASLGALAPANIRLPNTPVQNIAGKDIPDLTQPCKLAGPFTSSEFCAFAFADLSSADRLYQPELITVQTQEQLQKLLAESTLPSIDSSHLGTYVKLASPLPASFVKSLFKLNPGEVSAPFQTPSGYLIVKITRKDTAQKIEFTDLIRRFSVSGSKWSGGEISLTRDDKARDQKVVSAAYSLSKGAFSPVIKLNDTTYTFIKMEEKKPAYTRPFSEVKGKIENKLRREKEKELYDQLIARLREKAKIEILMKEDDFKTETTEPAEEQK
ncbi:MAG: peptidyl-prolyl cis-trans isomerase [candidate division WOR-3 bacterium]